MSIDCNAPLKTSVEYAPEIIPIAQDPVMNALGQRAGEVCSSIAAEDPVSQALFSHIVEFRSSILRWTNTSEKEYMRVRSLPFTYPSA